MFMDFKFFLSDIIHWIDNVLFNLHKKFFPKHLEKQIAKNPDKISFLTWLGFRIIGWM